MIKVGNKVKIIKNEGKIGEHICQFRTADLKICNNCPMFLEKSFEVLAISGGVIYLKGDKIACSHLETTRFNIKSFIKVYNWIPLKEIK